MPAKIPRANLLEELRRLADEKGGPPTQREMNDDGAYSAGVYQNRFGSWNEALAATGVDPDNRSPDYQHTERELTDDLRDFADELGRRPRIEDMNESGPHAVPTYQDRFGSWSGALAAAGFNPDVRIETTELIEALQTLADDLGHQPSYSDMEEQGRYGTTVYRDRFGSWTAALEAAGLSDLERPPIRARRDGCPSREDLLSHLSELAEHLGGTPSFAECLHQGDYSPSVYTRKFGSWNAAVRAAGMEPNQEVNMPDDVLLTRLTAFAASLGRSPTATEMAQHGPHSHRTYQNRFGSWNEALREAGLEVNRERNVSVTDTCANCGGDVERRPHHKRDYQRCFCSPACMGEWQATHYVGENNPRWSGGYDGQYGTGWTKDKKRAVRRACNFECQACRMTQAEHREQFGCRLPVHHIRREEYFDTEQEFNNQSNLITLCSRCHPRWEGIPLQPDTRPADS